MTECHRHLVLCTQTNPTGKQVAELGGLSAMHREKVSTPISSWRFTPHLTKPQEEGKGQCTD